MKPQTALRLAHLKGAIQAADAMLKAQLDLAGKLQQQIEKLQQQYDELQEVEQ